MKTTRVLAGLAVSVLGLSALAQPTPSVLREGAGERRAELDKMELTPFDTSLLAGLQDWRGGEALTPTDLDGKVVLIYTWAGYLPTATRPMSVINRLAERHPDDLVVIGAHEDRGWEEGLREAERRRAAFPVARDAGNALRSALKVDQDPDFYVIDRSGRLRYADIDTGSVERAVQELLAEDAGQAASLLDRMEAEKAAAAEAARQSQRLRSRVDLRDLPWVPFDQPSAEEYASAKWPEKKQEDDRNRRRRDTGSDTTTVTLDPELSWSPSLPRNVEGRATLIYLFTPDIISQAARGGYSALELFQWMDQLQTAHARDLLVVGVMIDAQNDDRNRRRRDDDEPQNRVNPQESFEKITRDMPVSHHRVLDPTGRLVTSRLTPDNGPNSRGGSRNQEWLLPYHILVSSDGQVRWHGFVSASPERFAEWEAAFDTMLRVDPGVNARREAEAAYIKSITD